jgi:hypothetical protein
VNLEFVDILAKSGPITINAISNGDSNDAGLLMGIRANGVNQVRLGAWASGGSSTSGSATISTPSATVDFSSSSSNVQINSDAIYSYEGGKGTVVNTSGSLAIQPATITDGLVTAASNFRMAHTAAGWRLPAA